MRRLIVPLLQRMTRRTFVAELGKATMAVAVLGLAACDGGEAEETAPPTTRGPAPTTSEPPEQPSSTVAEATEAVTLGRVSLGFVSAYVLARAGEATVVDTGIPGSGGEIEATLAALDLGWGAVGHVILTHHHPDHAGSVAEVLAAAPEAAAYAGAGDIPSISSPRTITPVDDGDSVFGLRIIATPGHTPGHISVLDPVGGLLVAGDALNGGGGGVLGPNPQFSSDMETAIESVRKLAGLTFETVVFGHGEPVEGGASSLVAELAAEL